MNIRELYSKFVEQENLPKDWKKQLYEALSSFVPGNLKTIDEHRMYVETLQQLRESNAEDMQLNGKKFLSTIASLLAVGEDGVYSSKLRFIYELIQNVDDCEYDDIEACNLDIQFVYDPAPGRIILTYNEKGFKPVNVFAITGIAEESKNISADKTEIGEKGIGFKSVFGVARKVHIESGMFSFELHKENFTVPIPMYENYEPYRGTRLTIYLDSSHNAKDIHRNLLEQYTKKDAILNKNPILFLNKLTHLRMFFDGWRYIEFNVKKKKKTDSSDLMYEEDVSVDMKSSFNGLDRENRIILTCKRYTLPIIYGQEACQSRYGNRCPGSINSMFAMINAKIMKRKGAFKTEEGCLSLDGVRPCTRYKEIEVDYLDQNSKPQHGKYTNWTAQIIQHELNHVDGIVI